MARRLAAPLGQRAGVARRQGARGGRMFAIRALFGAPTPQTSQTLADFSAKLAGDDVALSQYAGKVVLVVNVASE